MEKSLRTLNAAAQNPRLVRERRMVLKNCNTSKSEATRRLLLGACATALVVALMVSLPLAANAGQIPPPPVPSGPRVPHGNDAFLEGHGVGTQNYICLPSGSDFVWMLFTPQATLFDDAGSQFITHFFSPNPIENGTIRATWESSHDTSTVWAQLFRPAVTVSQDAIPWLLLQVVGAKAGPTGGDDLTATTFIQRLNTTGGVAPSIGCAASTDVGKKAFVPYTADYFFYRQADDHR